MPCLWAIRHELSYSWYTWDACKRNSSNSYWSRGKNRKLLYASWTRIKILVTTLPTTSRYLDKAISRACYKWVILFGWFYADGIFLLVVVLSTHVTTKHLIVYMWSVNLFIICGTSHFMKTYFGRFMLMLFPFF